MENSKETGRSEVSPAWSELDLDVNQLVSEMIGRLADKWTLLVLETLAENGRTRFMELGRQLPGISQKMLTQTLRQMECDGLVQRTVYAEVPPRVEYELSSLGVSLGEALCGVWKWAEAHIQAVHAARERFASDAS